MAESLLQELKRYIGFSASDEAELREFLPIARPHFKGIVERFYDRILQHEGAARALRSGSQVERLKVELHHWLERLLGGPWDQEFFDARCRIGRVHVKVQLPQRYMITSMYGVSQDLAHIAQAFHQNQADKLATLRDTLSRVATLDLAIMLESYREVTLEQVQRLERIEKQVLAEQLELTEERYLAVIENAPILVALVDSGDRGVFFNQKTEQITGWRASESADQNAFAKVIHPDDMEKMRSALAQARNGRNPPPVETRLRLRDGEQPVVCWHLRLQPGAAQTQVLAIGVDVTEERVLEERNRRTQRLASLGALAAGLAHEIRNPLNAAQLQLTLLERRVKKQQEVGEGAKLIRDELLRLAHLVQDFLAFARPARLRLDVLDLRSTVSSVMTLCAPDAKERGITLHKEIAPEPVVVRMDEERIRQVLLNLIQNGMEAVAEQHGQVNVRLFRKGKHAILEIADSGPGIPEGISVFEPFSSSKIGGTGLGLPIVHRIANDHGGEITLHRVDGETVFRVELPIEGPPG